eukprot:scaffold16934_cov80-Phaeocystis_antarctica.AAC.7
MSEAGPHRAPAGPGGPRQPGASARRAGDARPSRGLLLKTARLWHAGLAVSARAEQRLMCRGAPVAASACRARSTLVASPSCRRAPHARAPCARATARAGRSSRQAVPLARSCDRSSRSASPTAQLSLPALSSPEGATRPAVCPAAERAERSRAGASAVVPSGCGRRSLKSSSSSCRSCAAGAASTRSSRNSAGQNRADSLNRSSRSSVCRGVHESSACARTRDITRGPRACSWRHLGRALVSWDYHLTGRSLQPRCLVSKSEEWRRRARGLGTPSPRAPCPCTRCAPSAVVR